MSETTPQQVDDSTTAASSTTPATTNSPAQSKPQHEVKPVPQSHLQHMVDSSLISLLDRQVCVYTSDGSMFVGDLNGFDSVNGVTLNRSTQRWVHNGSFAERETGVVYLAGSNVLMVGTRNDQYLNELQEVPVEELLEAMRAAPAVDNGL